MSARGSGAKDAYGLDFSGPVPPLGCTSGTLHELYRDVAASGSRKSKLGNEHLELLLAVNCADDGID
jgi:hypothetical protein